MVLDAALPHYGIGRVAGLDLTVYSKMPVGDGAVPDVMVALAMPHKAAAMRGKDVPHLFFIRGHYMATWSCRSETKFMRSGECTGPLRASSSGTA